MPTVPRINTQTVNVNQLPAARLPATATPEQFGSQLGATANQAGQQLFTYYKQRADTTALMEADRKLLDFETDFLYGQNGAVYRTGKNAASLPDEFNQAWQKTSGEIRQGLTEDQQLAFDRRAMTRHAELSMNVQRHTADQMTKYEDVETKAYVESLVNHAGKNYQDPTVIASSALMMEQTLAKYAQDRGLGSAWLKTQVEANMSKMHATVLDQMISGDHTAAAKQYFTQNRADLEPETAARIEKALETSTVRGESQIQADKILASTQSLTAATAEARKISDPEVRDMTEQRVRSDWAVRQAAEKQDQDDRYLDATNMVEKGGLNSIPVPIWEKLTLQERASLKAYQKQRLEGIEPQQKDDVYVGFLDLDVQSVAKLTKADMLTKYRPYLDDAHFNSVLSRWDTFRTALEKKDLKDPAMTSVLSDDDRIRSALKSAGVISSAAPVMMSNKEKGIVADIQPAYERQLNALETSVLKRKATPEEKDKLLSEMFSRKVFVEKSWWFDSEKPVTLLTQDEVPKVYVPLAKIPPGAREQLRARARSIQAVPANTNLADIESKIGHRLERAYGAALSGASDAEVDAILKGAH